ncbi:MAG: hypothetical protein ACJAW9_003635 [Sulfitobacter sp.]
MHGVFLVWTDRLETNPVSERDFTKAPSDSPKTKRKLLLSIGTGAQCNYSGLNKPAHAPKPIRDSGWAEHIGKLRPAANSLDHISDTYFHIEIGRTCASINVETRKSTLPRGAKTRISMGNER